MMERKEEEKQKHHHNKSLDLFRASKKIEEAVSNTIVGSGHLSIERLIVQQVYCTGLSVWLRN